MSLNFNNKTDYLTFYKIDKKLLNDYTQIKIERKTAVHLFEPASIKKTVLLVHGYFDHTGSYKNVINFYLAKNYRVISYDLSGHGMSEGPRGEIEDFSFYVDEFQSVLQFTKEKGMFPNVVIGHSTGAAIITQYLLQYRAKFEKVIFLAPLVRATNWYYILASSKIVPYFKKNVTRTFSKNSRDENYLAFAKKDPLQCREISVLWVLAMIKWNKKVEELDPSTQEVLILQGTEDKTVDWKFNVSFLQKKFPFSKIVAITDGRHQLMNEADPIKQMVFTLIDKYDRS